MNDVLVVEIFDAFHDLFEKVVRFFLVQLSSLFKIAIEIRVTELSYNIHVIVCLKHIKQFDDIFMVNFLHYFDLGLYVFGVEVVGKKSFVNYFYCYSFPCLNHFASIH